MCAKGLIINVSLILCWLCVCSLAEEQQHDGRRQQRDDDSKRAPSGFTGVRGKKSVPPGAYAEPEDADSGVVDKRAPSGFVGMRGKKPWQGPRRPDEIYGVKRAPAGFMGMRGKKDTELADYGEDYLKRAPSAGFFGMRGKKDFGADYYNYPDQTNKRAPMGFVGMRGKKDDSFPDEEKRAPAGFFGMRGKKHPRQSGFFGMRGKKYPYEFRGKFVGVRGKKSDYFYRDDGQIDLENLSRIGRDLDLNQLMLLLSENDNIDRNDVDREWENDGSENGSSQIN